MRPVLIGDVIAVARVLFVLREADWTSCVDRLISQAKTADRYRRRLGKPHPAWGNGSLMAATAAEPKAEAEPFLSDMLWLRALSCVLDRLCVAKLSFVSDRIRLYDRDLRREWRQKPWPKPE
jgi:hypothetical protein